MSEEQAVEHRPASQWVIRPMGAVMVVGLIVLGIVLSGVVGDGYRETLATADADDSSTTTIGSASTTEPTAPVTVAPSFTPATVASTSAPPPAEPTVVVTGIREPCKFGSDCIIASFSLEAFDPLPTEFTCEFSNGSYTFSLRERQAVDRACMSGDVNDTITIVVNGVRSDVVSRDSIGG